MNARPIFPLSERRPQIGLDVDVVRVGLVESDVLVGLETAGVVLDHVFGNLEEKKHYI